MRQITEVTTIKHEGSLIRIVHKMTLIEAIVTTVNNKLNSAVAFLFDGRSGHSKQTLKYKNTVLK